MRISVVTSLIVLFIAAFAVVADTEAKAFKRVSIFPQERVLTPYQRPTATTREQRRSVQGAPCVTCGKSSGRMHADHKDPLIRQHQRGPIDVHVARQPEAVQPQCPTCSARQGGQLRAERQRFLNNAVEAKERVARGCPALAWIKNGGKC